LGLQTWVIFPNFSFRRGRLFLISILQPSWLVASIIAIPRAFPLPNFLLLPSLPYSRLVDFIIVLNQL
jgi:hypothetical protein